MTAFSFACQRTYFQEVRSPSKAPTEILPSSNPAFKRAVPVPENSAQINQPTDKETTPSSPHREYIFPLRAKSKKKINFLFVLDPSTSMDPFLREIGRRLSPLLSHISDHDYWMAFTSADNGDQTFVKTDPMDQWQNNLDESRPYFGKLMNLEGPGEILKRQTLKERILTSNTPDKTTVFMNTVSQVLIESRHKYRGEEQPLRALKSAMERAAFDNGDFFRADMETLVTFIVTNSNEREGDPERATTAQDVKETFDSYLNPLGNKRFFHFNILVKDKKCLYQYKPNEAIGTRIMKLANITTGPEGNTSLCEEDFGPAFQRVSKLIETLVEYSVDIKEPFIPETFKVEFLSGSPLPYRLSAGRVIFEREPSENTKVKISFSIPPQ